MVNTAIAMLGYSRPEQTKNQIELLRKAKASKIYFFVDHPKSDNNNLAELNIKVKELARTIDWDCDVVEHFFPKNLGPWTAYNKIMEFVFKIEDRVIYLEDDKIPSLSYFVFCDTLLEKYKNDQRILFISGLNKHQVYPDNYPYDYFFATENHHEGHAIWKRSYDLFNSAQGIYNNEYFMGIYSRFYRNKRKQKIRQKQLKSFNQTGSYNGAPPSMEFYLSGPLQFLNNSLVIVPSKNMIQEIAPADSSVHGDAIHVLTSRQQKSYFKKTFELELPIKHPPYVINDYKYFNDFDQLSLFIILLEKIERVIRIIRYRGFNALIDKIKTKLDILANKDYLNK